MNAIEILEIAHLFVVSLMTFSIFYLVREVKKLNRTISKQRIEEVKLKVDILNLRHDVSASRTDAILANIETMHAEMQNHLLELRLAQEHITQLLLVAEVRRLHDELRRHTTLDPPNHIVIDQEGNIL